MWTRAIDLGLAERTNRFCFMEKTSPPFDCELLAEERVHDRSTSGRSAEIRVVTYVTADVGRTAGAAHQRIYLLNTESAPPPVLLLGLKIPSEGEPPADQEVAFDRVRGEFDGSVVNSYWLVVAAQLGEQVGAGGMIGLVVIERRRVDPGKGGEPLDRPIAFGNGH
jgi:hypothetical protein